MTCECCLDYDIFNYMEIGFCSLLLIFLVMVIIIEFYYMKKVDRIEKDLDELTKHYWGLDYDKKKDKK